MTSDARILSTRTCHFCGEDKPFTDFVFNRGERGHKCQDCRAKYRRENIEQQRAYVEANRDKIRDLNFRKLYGITLADFTAKLTEQGGRCAICRTSKPGGKGFWHADHDHRTNRFRGVLCHNCNVGIGNFKDDPSFLEAAARYLRDQ